MARGIQVDFNANIARFTSSIDKISNDLTRFQTNANRTASNVEKSFQRLGSGINGVFGGLVAAVSVRELAAMADSFQNIQARLKLATRDASEFALANENILRIATSSKSPLDSTANLYTRISQSLLDVGGSQKQVADTTQALALSLRLSGATAGESASAMLQFSQAIGSGVLRGEEFNAVNEAAPRAMRALADALGVPIGKLREMAKEGQITRDILVDALGSQLPKLIAEAGTLPNTIGAAVQSAKNELLLMVGAIDKISGASGRAANAIGLITRSFAGWRDALGEAGPDSGISDRLREIQGLTDSALKVRKLFSTLGLRPPEGASDSYLNKLNQEALTLKKNLETLRSTKVTPDTGDGADAAKKLQDSIQSAAAAKKREEAIKAAAAAAKALASQQNTFIAGLQKEASTLGASSVQLKLYEAGILKITGAKLESVKADALKIQNYKLEQDALKNMLDFEAKQAQDFYDARDKAAKDAQNSLDALNKEGQNLTFAVDPMARMNAEVARYSELLKSGAIDQRIFELAVKQSTDTMKKSVEGDLEKMSAAAIAFQTNVQRNLGEGLFQAMSGNFDGIGSLFKNMLLRMLADAAAANLSSAIFGKNGAGGLLSIAGSLLGGFGGIGGGSKTPGMPKMAKLWAKGGAFGPSNVIPFARGGIVDSPTSFRFASGGMMQSGIMGEAGPEAIMPLKRGPDGKLGVSGGGKGGVVVNNNQVVNIDSRSDRASILQDIRRLNQQSNAELVDKLSRQGAI